MPAPVHGWPELFDDTIGFRPAEAVAIAASMYPGLSPEADPASIEFGEAMTELGDRSGRWLDRRTGELNTVGPKAFTFTISGGLVKVAVNDVRSGPDRLDDDTLVDGGHTDPSRPEIGGSNLDGVDGEEDDDAGGLNVVGGFSRRSRNRCRAAGASVDWEGARRDGHFLLMVTCTYPANWRAVAPDPQSVNRHRRALQKRYERATGYALAVIWKREFQKRGAPHLHLFGWWPWKIGDRSIQSWLSHSWYEIVGSENYDHFMAGTGVDYRESFKMSDPNRVGNYFASYATAKGYKDYQNHAPIDWTNPNGSVGRYWGIVGLERLHADVAITEADMDQIQRLLRGVLGAQKRTHRTRYSTKGQRPGGLRRRMVTRRYRLSSLKGASRGFTFLTNDGAQLAYDIARAVQLDNTEPWPSGHPRPLP